VQRVDDPSDLIDATDETLARLTAQAEQVRGAQLVHLLRLFADAQAEMRLQAPARLAVELATVRATVPEAESTAESAIARIERLERLLDVGARQQAASPVQTPAPEPAAPKPQRAKSRMPEKPADTPAEKPAAPPGPSAVASELVDLDKVRRDWPLVLEEVRKVRKSLHALLSEGRPRSLEDGRLQLECRYDFHARQLTEAKNANAIGEAIRSVFGVTLLIVTTVNDEPVEAPAAEPGEEVSTDPLDVLSSRLGAEIIEEI